MPRQPRHTYNHVVARVYTAVLATVAGSIHPAVTLEHGEAADGSAWLSHSSNPRS